MKNEGVNIIAELLRAEGPPAKHPFLRNFGNPPSRVNLVMTSPYERCPSVRPSVQTLGEEEGSLQVTRTGALKNANFPLRNENSLPYCYVNK